MGFMFLGNPADGGVDTRTLECSRDALTAPDQVSMDTFSRAITGNADCPPPGSGDTNAAGRATGLGERLESSVSI